MVRRKTKKILQENLIKTKKRIKGKQDNNCYQPRLKVIENMDTIMRSIFL